MSEKTAKAERKKEEEQKVQFQILINVFDNGGYSMDVPRGASIPLALDVLMRAQYKVYTTFLETMARQGAKKPIVSPIAPGSIPEGLLRRGQ